MLYDRYDLNSSNRIDPEIASYLLHEGFDHHAFNRWKKENHSNPNKDLMIFFLFLQKFSLLPIKISKNLTDFIINHNLLPLSYRPWSKETTATLPQDQLDIWLTHQLIPSDVWNKLITLNPPMQIWHEKMIKELAPFKYSLLLHAISKFLTGLGIGVTISVSTPSAVMGAVSLRLILAALSEPMSVESFSPVNRLRAYPKTFADDIEAFITKSQLPDEMQGFDYRLAITSFVENLHQQMIFLRDQIGLKMMLAGIVLSHSVMSKNLLSTAVVTTAGLLEMKALQKLLLPIVKFSNEFHKIEKEIRLNSEYRRILTMVGGQDHEKNNLDAITALSERRVGLTTTKQNVVNTMQEMIITVVAMLSSQFSNYFNEGLSGPTLAAVQLGADVTNVHKNLITALNTQKIAQRDRDELRRILDYLLHSGERRRRTSQDIDMTQRPNNASTLLGSDGIWQLIALGIPPVGHEDGSICQRVNWANGSQELKPGGLIVIMGGNHTGKSTVLRTLTGEHLGNPVATNITLNDVPLTALTIAEQQHYFTAVPPELPPADYSLKKTVVTILLSYRHQLKLSKGEIDKNKLKSWLTTANATYPELESAIISYINNLECGLQISQTWFNGDYQPSGFEQGIINLALYLLINEPIMLTIDDPLQNITEENTKYYLQLLKLVQDSPLRAMLSINQRRVLIELFNFHNLHSIVDMKAQPEQAVGVNPANLFQSHRYITHHLQQKIKDGLIELANQRQLSAVEWNQLFALSLHEFTRKFSISAFSTEKIREMINNKERDVNLIGQWQNWLNENFSSWLQNTKWRDLNSLAPIINAVFSLSGLGLILLAERNLYPLQRDKILNWPADQQATILSRENWLILLKQLKAFRRFEISNSLAQKFWLETNPDQIKQDLTIIRLLLLIDHEWGLFTKHSERNNDSWAEILDGDLAWSFKTILAVNVDHGGMHTYKMIQDAGPKVAKMFYELPADQQLEKLFNEPLWLLYGHSLYVYFYENNTQQLAPPITRKKVMQLIEKSLANCQTIEAVDVLLNNTVSKSMPHIIPVKSDVLSIMRWIAERHLFSEEMFITRKKELLAQNGINA